MRSMILFWGAWLAGAVTGYGFCLIDSLPSHYNAYARFRSTKATTFIAGAAVTVLAFVYLACRDVRWWPPRDRTRHPED